MKNKVVLIQPKNTLSLNIYPPLNLILIGSSLQKEGYEVRIITCPTVEHYLDVISQECSDALFAGVSILTPEVPNAIKIAEKIRQNHKIPIVWGGWHSTLFPEQIAKSNLVDKIIIDEGDISIIQVADEIKKGSYKDFNNKIVRNTQKLNMEQLPFPDYSLVPNIELYINSSLADKFLAYDKRKVRWLPYQASRGCPGRCTFCINVVTDNRKYRHKSAEKVVDEIETIMRNHNINHLKIIDDNLFVNIEWIKNIARMLIDKNLGITWDAECRVNYFNEHMLNDECLELLVRSGLNELNFGIESGSHRTLNIMKKDITPEHSLYAVRKSSEFGIVSRCSFIIDIPGEKKEDILETVKLVNEIREIPRTTCGVHTYRPYPKSELCEELLKTGVIKQPATFEGWGKKEFVEQFTHVDAKRKWQSNFKISSKISFYQNLESGFWLRPHQIKNTWIRKINNIFMWIGKVRNRKLYFKFVIDRYIYVLFRLLYFKHLEWKHRP